MVSTPFFLRLLELHPLFALVVGGVVEASGAQITGETSIKFYKGELDFLDPELTTQI